MVSSARGCCLLPARHDAHGTLVVLRPVSQTARPCVPLGCWLWLQHRQPKSWVLLGTQGGHQSPLLGAHQAFGLTEGTQTGRIYLPLQVPTPAAGLPGEYWKWGCPTPQNSSLKLQASCGPGPLEQQVVQELHDPPGGLWTAPQEQA